MIALLLNFIGLCFSIFIIVIVILTWTNTNKLVHSEPFLGGESIVPGKVCFGRKNQQSCEFQLGDQKQPLCRWVGKGFGKSGGGVCLPN